MCTSSWRSWSTGGSRVTWATVAARWSWWSGDLATALSAGSGCGLRSGPRAAANGNVVAAVAGLTAGTVVVAADQRDVPEHAHLRPDVLRGALELVVFLLAWKEYANEGALGLGQGSPSQNRHRMSDVFWRRNRIKFWNRIGVSFEP